MSVCPVPLSGAPSGAAGVPKYPAGLACRVGRRNLANGLLFHKSSVELHRRLTTVMHNARMQIARRSTSPFLVTPYPSSSGRIRSRSHAKAVLLHNV